MTWLSILAGYLVIGVVAILLTPARREVTGPLRSASERDRARWVYPVFVMIVVVAAALLWPLVLHSHIKKREPKSAYDALMEIPQMRQQKDIFDAMAKMCEDGVDADELPNGYGDFGLVATNPIPCRTTFESAAYLRRLRTSDSAEVLSERVGHVMSDVSPMPIDRYEIRHSDRQDLATIYISPYQKRNSRQAPKGFSLLV